MEQINIDLIINLVKENGELYYVIEREVLVKKLVETTGMPIKNVRSMLKEIKEEGKFEYIGKFIIMKVPDLVPVLKEMLLEAERKGKIIITKLNEELKKTKKEYEVEGKKVIDEGKNKVDDIINKLKKEFNL